jgi:HPt (histidine-containing phosphotransfer) domain-containing protein
LGFEVGVTLAVCLCACLLAALAYAAYRVRLQAGQIRRIALERLRLETELEQQARELRESNRALADALQRIEDLLAGEPAGTMVAADASAGASNDSEEQPEAPPEATLPEATLPEATLPEATAEDQIWSDIDSAAVARLRNLRGNSRADLYDRLVELFESGSARALVELRTALERGSFDDAAAISHKFASSAANVGALTFAQGVRELERLCRAGDAGHSLGLYLRLRTAHPRLMVILQGLRQKASA